MSKPLAFNVGSEDDSAFNIFLPLSKVKKNDDGSCTVAGYASTPALDLDGEIVSLDAVKAALPGYWEWRNIREMHQPSAVGVAKEANVDDKGLFLTARITDPTAVQKCLDEVYKGFSIGGRKLAKTGNTITEIEMVEVSIVDRPANPECKLNVQKRAKDGGEAYLIKLRSSRSAGSKALVKMAEAVEILAKDGPPAAHDGFSLPFKHENHGIGLNGEREARRGFVKADSEPCSKHNRINCAKCIAKRDVKTKERTSLASHGDALPDGSFPIKNKGDLANARQAVGRSKNPGAARALIRRRAKELGVKLPDTWSKKQARALIQKAEQQNQQHSDELHLAASFNLAEPFLSLDANSGADATEGWIKFGHGLDLTQNKKGKVKKGMSVAGSLAYCFDSIRGAQRSLLMEGEREGGDKHDHKLADQLGHVAQTLAEVIGQKAAHEGQEALDLSDADDKFLNLEGISKMSGNEDTLEKVLMTLAKAGKVPSKAMRMQMARGSMKKARKSAKDLDECVKAAHAVLKAAYIAKQAENADLIKAGKKPPMDDSSASAKAMEKLQKAYALGKAVKTHLKAANSQIKKAAGRSGERGQEAGDAESGFYEVPAGVHDLNPSDLEMAGPGSKSRGSAPAILGMEHEYPGKGAKVKYAKYLTPDHVELITRAAKAEAQVEILSKLPAGSGGSRPALFNAKNLGHDPKTAEMLMKNVDPLGLVSTDERTREQAVGTLIGNQILSGMGKSVFSSDFQGTAGA